ncbi:MAG: RnfABCDGE type electron transport complex subunit B [Oscillospiraceae bacterium]|nr:RnfABCDGE type electron transport complex subunit B [Oscillospiraceae bacterium]
MSIIIAVGVLAAVGALCALLLVISSKYMAVPVDEKFPIVRGCLPGANCGACGYAGCDGYASALVSGDEDKPNKCVAGGADVAKALAEALGTEAGEVIPMVAVTKCRGNCEATSKKADYQGTRTCAAAKLLHGGDGACSYGCLGYGDCAAACPEGGINIINGVAHFNSNKCIGCGICAKTCPQGIISIVPAAAPVRVLCSNKEKGAQAGKNCKNACIGCGLCMKNCPNGAVTVQNNLAVIDYEKCTGCGKCKEVCPKKVIG